MSEVNGGDFGSPAYEEAWAELESIIEESNSEPADSGESSEGEAAE